MGGFHPQLLVLEYMGRTSGAKERGHLWQEDEAGKQALRGLQEEAARQAL